MPDNMTHRDIAMEFLTSFCAGDVGGLAALLAEDLRFKGPLYEFNSSRAYLDSLRADPPQTCGFRVLSVTEGRESVCVFYEYAKRDGALTIAQLFRFRDQKIVEMLLAFDTRGLA